MLANGSQPGNYWITATGYYEPTGKEGAQEKGVFLNQGIIITPQGQWQPPYYSVKAEAMQDIFLEHTGRTHKFYFQGWSSTPQGSAEFQNANALETPVVFKQEGAVVSANYKGSMLSNSVNAILSTSQRKVVRTQNGHLHIVYESMGKLWYQKSTNGTTWSEPKLIDLLSSEIVYKNPALAFHGNTVYLTFEAFDEMYPQEKAIFLYSIDSNGNISNLVPYGNFLTVVQCESKPVVAANEENIIIVYKQSETSPLFLIRSFYDGNQWNFSQPVEIPYTTENSQLPVNS